MNWLADFPLKFNFSSIYLAGQQQSHCISMFIRLINTIIPTWTNAIQKLILFVVYFFQSVETMMWIWKLPFQCLTIQNDLYITKLFSNNCHRIRSVYTHCNESDGNWDLETTNPCYLRTIQFFFSLSLDLFYFSLDEFGIVFFVHIMQTNKHRYQKK